MNRTPTRRTSPRVALYARVSTDHQSVNNQLEDLRRVGERLGWSVAGEYVDKGISGAKGREGRPALDKMLRGVTRGEFDLVAAWSVDRLGRSLQHLVALLADIKASGCGLYLHQQALDTSTPSGEALFGMLGVFAQFERGMIRERVTAGLRRAKAAGVTIGRPRVGDDTEQRIRGLFAEGVGKVRIAKEVGCGVSTVQRVLMSDAAAAGGKSAAL